MGQESAKTAASSKVRARRHADIARWCAPSASCGFSTYKTVKAIYKTVMAIYKTVKARYKPVKARYKTVKARYKKVKARHKTVKARYKTVKGTYKIIKAIHKTVKCTYKTVGGWGRLACGPSPPGSAVLHSGANACVREP